MGKLGLYSIRSDTIPRQTISFLDLIPGFSKFYPTAGHDFFLVGMAMSYFRRWNGTISLNMDAEMTQSKYATNVWRLRIIICYAHAGPSGTWEIYRLTCKKM